MRRLIILKSVIDLIWLLTCIPLVLLSLFLIGFIIVSPEVLLELPVSFDVNFKTVPFLATVVAICFIVFVLAQIYSVFLFRKTIRFFLKKTPFHSAVIKYYSRIGKILVITGPLMGAIIVFFELTYSSKLTLSLGFTPYLLITALGLFFMVLSATFKIAKQSKEENDLTI